MSTYKLHVQNYQIIKDAELLIPQGLTLIQGHSNHGKSSLFKALRQLLYNTSGTDYIKHHTNQCLIELTYFQDDTNSPVYYIQYLKSHTKSQYTIQTPQNGTEVYSKLGSSQLDLIKDLTHIDKQLDYNFWSQMEKPFLIGLTPREQFDILQNSPHSAVLQSCLLQMTTDRKTYQKQELQFQSQLELIQHQNLQYQNDLQKLPLITHLFTSIDALKDTNTHLKELSTKIARLSTLSTETLELHQQVDKLHTLPSLDSLISLNDTINQFTLKFKNLQQTIYPINDLKNQIQQTATEYDRLSLFINQHFPNCPLCNQPFTHSHRKETSQ